MKKNESIFDRLIRMILAIIFLLLSYYLSGFWSIVFYILTAISAITALSGFCLLYKVFNINTNRVLKK